MSQTLKEKYECPFEIWYYFIDYHKTAPHQDKMSDLFYFVNITSVYYHHSCSLNTKWAHEAKQKTVHVNHVLLIWVWHS
jgi:hypothetical protein